MAKKQQKGSAVNLLIKAFAPIILNDKDIQEFISENKLDQNEISLVSFWLASAAASLYLSAADKKRFVDEIEEANSRMVFAEQKLSEKYDDIRTVLDAVLKENIEEWFEIMSDLFKKAHIESEDSNPKLDSNNIERIIGVYQKLLFPIILREDDVIEFSEKFPSNVRNLIVNFVCLYILWNLAQGYARLDEKDRPQDPISVCAEQIDKELEKTIKNMSCDIQNQVDNADAFVDGIKEITEDHFKEFVKKMYKAMAKLGQQ